MSQETQGQPSAVDAAKPADAPAVDGKPADVVPAAPAAVAAPDEKLSRGWDALAQKERSLSLQSKKLSEERAALEATRAEAAKLAQLKSNPGRVLQEQFGEDWYEKLSRVKLGGGQVTPELVAQSMDEKLESFRREQAAKDAKAAEAAHQRELQRFRAEAEGFAKSKSDDYELINLHGSHAEVHKLIEQHYRETTKFDDEGRVLQEGELLSLKQAADKVEARLEEMVKKSQSAKKFQAKTSQPPAVPERKDTQHRRATLSNDMTATTPSAPPPAKTDEERRERAFAAWDRERAKAKAAATQ